MPKTLIVSIAAASLLLASCTQDVVSDKKAAGTVIGSIVGLIVGSKLGSGTGRTVAMAVGGIAGAWIGSEIGQKLNERDQELAREAADEALENGKTGNTDTWSNPDSGNSGSVTPVSDSYETVSNEECRDFESTVTVEGETEVAHGRACRQEDGSWKIVR